MSKTSSSPEKKVHFKTFLFILLDLFVNHTDTLFVHMSVAISSISIGASPEQVTFYDVLTLSQLKINAS